MKVLGVSPVHVLGDQEMLGLGITGGKGLERLRVEIIGTPLAFNREGRLATPSEYKIHFVSLFVAPIVDAPRLQARMEFVEDVVLPQQAHVVAARLMPTTEIAYEAGIEAVYLRRRYNFRDLAGRIGPNHVRHKSRLQNRQIIGDRSAADFARASKTGSFENPAARRQQQFDEGQK